MFLPDISVRRPVLATVMSLIILLMGIISFERLTVREYPNIDAPVVSVRTVYKGASAEVVESQITNTLEDSLSGIEGIRQQDMAVTESMGTIYDRSREHLGTTDALIIRTRRRMIQAAKAGWDHFGVVADFRTLAGYFERLETRSKPAINIATFVGAGGIRDYVIGRQDRRATSDELEQMKRLVAQAMEEGALGLSTSLQYVPDRFASTDEIVELARVARRYGGVYFTHQRSESGRIVESMDEAFAVAERANIPTEIWHLKTAYKANWGRMPEVLQRLEDARARGLDVTADQYPYTRASNDLDACLPLWVREGSEEEMIRRLKDPALRDRIRREMDDPNVEGWENQWYGSGGGDGVMVSSVLDPNLRRYEGLTLTDIGRLMGKDPRDALMDLVKETIKTVRRISSELRPSILDDLGLAAALEWLGRDFEARTGLKCTVSVPNSISLSPQRAIVLFRMCQEALTNVARHAKATRVSIDLVEADNQLTLEVRDNGRGISEQELEGQNSLGLLGLRERAALLGGSATVTGEPGRGTSVVIQVPLKEKAGACQHKRSP